MLVCIEGMDGCGKSTISNKISKKLGFNLISKPITNLLELSRQQELNVTEKLYSDYSCHMQAIYYLTGYLSALEQSKNKNICMDRGIISTYYFSANEENMNLFDFFAQNYGGPDLTIVLYASTAARVSRISNRDCNDGDLLKARVYEDGYSKYFEALEKYNFPYLIIDTEQLEIEDIVDFCSEIINKLSNHKDKAVHIKDFLCEYNDNFKENNKSVECFNQKTKELKREI